ncbi:MAG: hypothetical protein IBX47_02430 [Desulfuromonadales bacterium]|nr:hypothetical protein [Desulfuromonadales bacterium]
MHRPAALISVCFCAGILGALVGLGVISAWGMVGLPDLPISTVRPLLAPAGLYPRLVWGGLWGVLFFLTVGSARTRKHWIQKGVLVSLVPTFYYLIFYLPEQISSGSDFSLVALAVVIAVNLIWGFFTGLFSRLLWGRN